MGIKQITFPPKSIVFALLAVCIISFGLLIPSLGFYWDDWEIILVQESYGPQELWSFFGGGLRPIAAWSFIPLSHLFGSNPFLWQIFSLLMRLFTIFSMGWMLFNLWPRAKRQVACSAILFAIYPIFIQQPISVAYQRHWLFFGAFFVSMGFMILSITNPQKRWLYTGLSVLMMLMHLSSLEYFIGLELLRPVILWILLGTAVINRQKIGTILKLWLPYLIILIAFSAWRINASIQQSVGGIGILPADSNPPALLFDFLTNPLITLKNFLEVMFQDMVHILFSSWNQTLNPTLINLSRPFTLFSWGMVILTAILLAFYLGRVNWGEDQTVVDNNGKSLPWHFEALGFGLISIFLAMLPVWMIYQRVSVPGNHADRFGFAAMFGASLVWVALLEWLLKSNKVVIAVALMAGLAVGLHLRVSNDYAWSWTKQQRVYWQLFWRAPSILPGTNILSDRDLFSYNRPSFSFNVLYDQPKDTKELAYRFFIIPESIASPSSNWFNGGNLDVNFRIFTYKASTSNSLVIFYEPPEITNCLWILTPEDAINPYLTDKLRDALPFSNLSRIQPQTYATSYPSRIIFGSELEGGWCYYYQKAELARQNQDWARVVDLGEEAQSMGFHPGKSQSNSPQEWLAFIEGYAHQNRWEEALEFSQTSLRVDSSYRQVLCALWQKIELQTQDSSIKTNTLQGAYNELECNPAD